MRTRFGLVVEIASPTDRDGYVDTIAVCTGRSYGRIHASGLLPVEPLDVERARADLMALAASPPPQHPDSELARARQSAIRALAR
jgi:hypothetical protein